LAVLQYFFFRGIGCIFCLAKPAVVWIKAKWEQLKNAMDRAHYGCWYCSYYYCSLSHWLRALRWRQLMEPLGYHPSKLNSFFAVMIGYFVNLGAPRLGEVLKCTILARYGKNTCQTNGRNHRGGKSF